MGKIILGLLIIGAGFMITYKSEWLLHNLGRVQWAEAHLGLEGGTRLFYRLIGIGIIFLGIFIITDIWSDLLGGFVKLFIK
ncbi:hypothetical protein MYX07_05920 [Patescibacteria group bacterium AH-259-L07]|nr:hypothetical protein [Patescibacteria group bacterium AH-259-L07]